MKAEKPVWYISVAAGAILKTLELIAADQDEFVRYLEKGHLPPSNLNPTSFEESFVLEGDSQLSLPLCRETKTFHQQNSVRTTQFSMTYLCPLNLTDN